MQRFQLELDWSGPAPADDHRFIEVEGQTIPLDYRRNDRARRYRLFVDREGRPRVTIPRRGTQREAERFVHQHRTWLVRQLRQAETRRAASSPWRPGREIWFRGERTPLEWIDRNGASEVRFGTENFPAPPGSVEAAFDLRSAVEQHLRKLANRELPLRVRELAAQHQSTVRRVSVRSQRSRWGSCSRRGTISLNWRLVQTPAEVRDYIIVHELMHLKEMNHSRRYWAHVAAAFPGFEACETWLRQHGRLLP